MKIIDIIKMSQRNLLRAKLRTFLTVAAIFIGALTLSLTNGLGSGIRAYVDEQLGNIGAKETLVIAVKQEFNPLSDEVRVYDPNKTTLANFNISMLGKDDLEKIATIPGVLEVVPQYPIQIEYITSGGEKYEATAIQYIEGLNIAMSAGDTVQPFSNDIAIPQAYLKSLGFTAPQDAVFKSVSLGFKNATGEIVEKRVTIVGVQKKSLLGNSGISISGEFARQIHAEQKSGLFGLADNYINAIAKYSPSYTKTQVDELKKRLGDAGYMAQTIEERIGIVATVINTILIVLNVFGAITLLAATFGIVNTLLMSVNERTSEIGLMKALGANRRTIFSIFAFEAASIGFWGALLGVLTSMAIGAVVSNYASQNFLKGFEGFELVTFPIASSLIVLFGIILLAFLAGTLPSLKASKLQAIRALRYE
ncbi:MAG: FtsX-like permease family protein [bacterium]|nr:FtsX-like permease family protein [bacterium]